MNFIFDLTSFLIASYQILKNYAIFINYKSLSQEKDSNFRKGINYFQIQQFVYKNFVLENVCLVVSAIEEFIFKNQKR